MRKDPLLDPDVARYIELTNMCQLFHCLPNEGGLLDQDHFNVLAMAVVLEARADREKFEAGTAEMKERMARGR